MPRTIIKLNNMQISISPSFCLVGFAYLEADEQFPLDELNVYLLFIEIKFFL